jgi:hypothetical protein
LSSGARAAALLEVRVGPARVWCTGRAHGNVGDHVGDDPLAVARHRADIAARTDAPDPRDWVWLQQVHGNAVHVATEPPRKGDAPPVADAAVTGRPGLALAVVTADCAPVVVAADGAVAVVHAGHRGVASGVIETAIEKVRELGSGPVHAFLGPCIRAAHYEFGRADLDRFVAQFGPGAEGRTVAGRPALDIPVAIGVILEQAGVATFDDCGRDTAATDEYFSYRQRADAGRQATIVMLS